MRNYRKTRRGFTLIEASLATVIIGVGVVAMLELIAAGTRVNVDNTQRTTATNLAKNVREYALKLTYAQLVALNGSSWTPPIDSRGVAVSDFDDWKQSITVSGADPNQLTRTVSLGSAKTLKLTVTVTHNSEQMSSLSWYAFNATP
jgi:prepilin-type N-terminal cleavage/methylation domain-containing protein